MLDKEPLVTIVMATWQGEEYLPLQLESIEKQSYTNWQLVVRDDGSQDHTVELLTQFAARVPQKVQVMQNQPGSGSAQKNFAWLLQDACKLGARYTMCCDQDDIWKPEKVKLTLDRMLAMEQEKGNTVPILVHTDLEVVDQKGTQIAPSFMNMSQINPNPSLCQLLIQNVVTGCTMMMNQTLLEGIAGELERPEILMHDYWAALYAQVFGSIGVIREATIAYRQHGDNSVGAKASKNPIYLWKRLQQGKRAYRQAMHNSFAQIATFVSCYGAQISDRKVLELLEGYGALTDKSHRERVGYYKKHKIWKNGSIRVLMQRVWG